jgi:3-oxoacyl-(acyl-carrier-protein) synthase
MTGHALAAANAVESVAAVMSIYTGYIHPTINQETPDERCDLDYVPDGSRKVNPATILKNASGFSGIHSAAIFTAERELT